MGPGNAGHSEDSLFWQGGNNEAIQADERRGFLPFFRELSCPSLFLEPHFQECAEFRVAYPGSAGLQTSIEGSFRPV